MLISPESSLLSLSSRANASYHFAIFPQCKDPNRLGINPSPVCSRFWLSVLKNECSVHPNKHRAKRWLQATDWYNRKKTLGLLSHYKEAQHIEYSLSGPIYHSINLWGTLELHFKYLQLMYLQSDINIFGLFKDNKEHWKVFPHVRLKSGLCHRIKNIHFI